VRQKKNQVYVVQIKFMIAVAMVVKCLHLDFTPVKKLQLMVSITATFAVIPLFSNSVFENACY
jgi:thiamine transporter ThiT